MKLSTLIARFIDLFYFGPFRLMSLRTFRYAACGGMNMALDLVLYYLTFHYVLGKSFIAICWPHIITLFDGAAVVASIPPGIIISPHIAALGIVFPITFFNGFWLNRHVAFRQSPLPQGSQLVRYMLSVAGALLLNYVCMKLFVEVLYIYPTPSKALTTLVSVVYSYLMQTHYTFRGAPKY